MRRLAAARQLRGQCAFHREITWATPGGRLVEQRGVQAAIVDSAPDRSIPNAVVYEDGDALLDALDDLADAYADAGVRAWTVWVRPGDDRVAKALRAAGHRPDGEPGLMVGTLADMDLEQRGEIDVVRGADWRTVGAVNDAAWGIPAGRGFAEFMAPVDPALADRWIARVDGRPSASVVTHTDDEHTSVWLVATDPAARGRGLCSELMRTALRAARDAGARTTALEASGLGEGVYARLGYETIGRLALYERRVGR